MKIPEIQPFQFIRGTAFSERVQLANKVNEIIDGINSIGEIPELQAEIDTINATITQIQADIANTDTEISGIQSQVNTLIQEVNGLLSEVVNEIVVDSPGYGQVRVKLIHEDESETTSNALQIPVIQDGGITLISGTTDRSFKIQYITMDGVTHTTNDFVIPEGGGTDVTVTSISILQGDTANDIKFQIGLSDGSMIQSNSYPIPQAAITPATTSQLGGIKVGTNLSVTADGTLSVDMTTIGTAAAASTIFFTGDASKVTMHADSLLGSEFTEDLPQASTGGAGTIDAAAYQKLSNVPEPSTIATDSEISDLQDQITGLKLSKPNQNEIQLNGDNVTVVESVSGTVDDDGNLVITVNGVSGSGIPLPDKELPLIEIDTSESNQIAFALSQAVSLTLSQMNEPIFYAASKFQLPLRNMEVISKLKASRITAAAGVSTELSIYLPSISSSPSYKITNPITVNYSAQNLNNPSNIPDGSYLAIIPQIITNRGNLYLINNEDAISRAAKIPITISGNSITCDSGSFIIEPNTYSSISDKTSQTINNSYFYLACLIPN